MRFLSLFFTGLLFVAVSLPAQELKPISLPKPQTEGGKPLMQALNERKSGREFSSEKLPPQVFSNLLWAAWGVNRADGRRTAPSASNRQEIDVYVVTSDGVSLFDAKNHRLEPVAAGDFRAATGGQPFVSQAPLNLVYVADQAKTKSSDTAYIDTGFISQNVYLYCASEGLSTVVRGSVDRAALAKVLKLRPDQLVTVAQTVGYPKK